jgi:hypothetical protein
MMIDPLLSLSFTMHANKGVYALLLGSGVSRSAQIPTGWEVTLDLIRQLAVLQGEKSSPEVDIEQWYRDTYQLEPNYSTVLEAIAKSPAERSQKLKSYFEPTAEDREEGKKLPQDAHHAIAKLVSKGYIRVILTTNFDRLIELALEKEGITPTVIDTADKVEGSIPLTHSSCTVIKIHGDYTDTRIFNTEKELQEYDSRIDKLLDQVFDEYGLIICGWSGDWDPALRSALERCTTRRFSTYWTVKGELSREALELSRHRCAETITIQDADAFFMLLDSKIMALEEYRRPHPLSTALLIAELKKYIVEEKYQIRLNDMFKSCENELLQKLTLLFGNLELRNCSQDEYERVLKTLDIDTEGLLSLLAYGCYWGGKQHQGLWAHCITRFANFRRVNNVSLVLPDLQKCPALMALFVCGIACLASKKYDTLNEVCLKAKYREYSNSDEEQMLFHFSPSKILEKSCINLVVNLERDTDHTSYCPASIWLYDHIRPIFKDLLADEEEFRSYFDTIEYLFGIYYFAIVDGVAPIGHFWYSKPPSHKKILNAIIEAESAKWACLNNSVFKNDLSFFQASSKQYDEYLAKYARR